tara:strand:+ start:1401 stop:2069 length:669 start_codon:yes stop_codon:yes gene_type:complete
MLFVSIKQSKKKIKSNIMDNFIDNPKAPFYEQIKFAQLTCDQFKLQDKRIKELEKKTENIIKENKFWQNEVTSHADGLQQLEDIMFESEEYEGVILNANNNTELLDSHKELINLQDKRIKELEKKTENIIKENEFWQNEVTSHADGLEKLEDIIFENEEDDGLSKIDKNIELLISHKELMNNQNKRIDELEKKLSQSVLTSSIMFASGIIIGVVGSWRLLSK